MPSKPIENELFISQIPYSKTMLLDAIENKNRVIPELLNSIEQAIQQEENFFDQQDYSAFIYSIYLLAQFRESRAYPLLIEFLSTPNERVLELTGNMFIEDMGRIIASVSGGDISLIQKLIENTQANELIRTIGLEAIMVLVKNGEKTREEILAYFQSLMREKLERKNSFIWNSLVTCCVDLYPEELIEDLDQLYADGLIDEDFISQERVYEVLSNDKAEILGKLSNNPFYSYIDNVIQEMEDSSSLIELPE